jgi:hypothetical protein
MTEIDAMIRFYIAIVFMVIAVFSSQIVFLVLSIIFIFTAIKKRCFLYPLLGINKKLKSDFFYKNLYLENNNDIFFFLDEDDDIIYSNRVESNIYKQEVFKYLKNQIFIISFDESQYKIVYRSITTSQIRLIELKKL